MTKKRPSPLRCGTCGGFVYGPAIGESAAIVKPVKHSEQADPAHRVCGCARCGKLYELHIELSAAA